MQSTLPPLRRMRQGLSFGEEDPTGLSLSREGGPEARSQKPVAGEGGVPAEGEVGEGQARVVLQCCRTVP